MKIVIFDKATGDYATPFASFALCSFDPISATFVASAAAGSAGVGIGSAAAASAAAAGVGAAAASVGVGGAVAAGASTGLLASAGGFFASLSTFDLLTGGLSAFSAISNIAQGQAEAASLEEAALFEDFASKQELLKGRQEALRILEAETSALEQNIVNTAASGITGSGSSKAASDAISSKAKFETNITRSGAVINAEARKTQGRTLRLDATSASTGGVTRAASDVAGFFLRRSRRGKVPS